MPALHARADEPLIDGDGDGDGVRAVAGAATSPPQDTASTKDYSASLAQDGTMTAVSANLPGAAAADGRHRRARRPPRIAAAAVLYAPSCAVGWRLVQRARMAR